MATQTPIDIVPAVVDLTPEEAWAEFDAMTRRHLGVPGQEFLRLLDAGEYEAVIDDPVNHRWVGYLAQLSLSVR
jgi:hypothetical protein